MVVIIFTRGETVFAHLDVCPNEFPLCVVGRTWDDKNALNSLGE
jgi:hypothetical protein